MELIGNNAIGLQSSAEGAKTFRAFDPQTGKDTEPVFHEATASEIERALQLAERAVPVLWRKTALETAEFLLAIREEILAIGDVLLERASQETGLDLQRLNGERDRTLNQIKLFAEVVTDGSWVDAHIETPLPDRKPLPRPDLRRMLQPVGPVAVFGASNFPLAFSVAGGDTISAFAARNPVVVKAHPAHPGTSEMVANAVQRAIRAKKYPEGTFSMLHGHSPSVSVALVKHPAVKAVGFTGSLRVGRALFDVAAQRPDPIPVFAEMGSTNPVFILPEALKTRGPSIAEGLFRSVTLGVGQFCTSPGLVFGVEANGFQSFRETILPLFEQAPLGTMLNQNVAKGYGDKLAEFAALKGVSSQLSSKDSDPARTEGRPGAFVTDAETWLHTKELHEEIFGPATVMVRCGSGEELLQAARNLEGSLTATIHGTPEELAENGELIDILSRRAGRIIFNSFPTGVEVGYAMHHGGPWPATTDAKFTSVGTAAIVRFARPVCYQGFPEELLPAELQDKNPRQIWRRVNGQLTRDAI